ncbi:aa3-type cytochrome c oxidase subunit IV [Sneathiella chinensis]|uniref:Cytochrome c oxidase subunit IV bacterial aa3 type domain-containing protein n=1 Tax=Sneathiella chinensis TaxID=349750 RepID=A0ABQ5U450_9PROT|nr:aa3-type cytochrome c oxidase subunit IV [Sneathiella chinensis]GLQ06511.1 hypothetical protein GCM10007924_17320 [Sneathiella chinensis]
MSEHGNMNIEQQQGAYGSFVNLFTWGTIIVCGILALMALFLL